MTEDRMYGAVAVGDYTGIVLEEERDDLVRWLTVPPHPGEIVKENSARTVWKTTWRGPVFIKKFKAESIVQKLRLMFLASRAEKEFEILRRLSAVHAPVPFPVAFVVAGDGSYLVTHQIPDAIPVKDYLLNESPSGRRMDLLVRTVAGFAREMLDIGIYNRDFHIGNILTDPDNHHRLSLIDLQRTAWKGHLSRGERRRSIAFLTLSFLRFLSAAQAVRFVGEALGIRDRGERRDDVRAVLRDVFRMRDRYYRRHELRCLRKGSEFAARSGQGGWWNIRRGCDEIAVGTALETHLKGGNLFVKTLPNRRLTRFGKEIFVKEFRRPAGMMPFARLVGRDPGIVMWRMHQALAIRDLPTPPCHALFRTPFASHVVGEWIEGALPLNDYLKEHWRGMRRAERRTLIDSLAGVLRRMLTTGLYHRDLKANNIIVRRAGDRTDLFLLDLESVHHHNARSSDDMIPFLIRGLSQLNAAVTPPVTRADRLRFFHAVAGCLPLARDEKKSIVREIMRRTIARRHLWPSGGASRQSR